MKQFGKGPFMMFKVRRLAALIVGTMICICALVKPAVAQTARTSKSATKYANGVAAIEVYCRQLDTFRKRNRNRAWILGNIVSPYQETYPVPPNAPRSWDVYQSREARESAKKGDYFYDGAEVWMRNGKIVIAELQIDRNDTDAPRRAVHYFRPDGSLAKTWNQFFGEDYYTVKETIYDAEGKVLQVRTQCVETNKRGPGRIVKCPTALPSEVNAPVYERVKNLPFNDLITGPGVGTSSSMKPQ